MKENKTSFKDKWNEPLDKAEFKSILIKSIICMFLTAIVAGFLNYLFLYYNSTVLGAILIIPVFIGPIINRAIEKVHYKYYLIGFLLTLFGIFLANALAFILFNCLALNANLGQVFASANFYKFIFIYPIILFFHLSSVSSLVWAILELILYVICLFGVLYLIQFRKK